MRIICIEEHAIDPGITRAAQPALQRQAPYLGLQSSVPRPHLEDRPSAVTMQEAVALGTDLGEGRIRAIDDHGIQMQVASWISPAQLAPAGGRPGATFLDDPQYAPVLQKLSDLQVPLYVHPFSPLPQVHEAYYSGLPPMVSTEFSLGAWGWHNEAGVHVLRLILSGTFEKFPALQLISGHWGEMVPFYLQRLDDVMPPTVTGLSATISDIYRSHVWVTPSGMFSLPHFEFIHQVIGADRIIWSVDYPFLTLDGTREFLDRLPVSQDDKEKMAHRNAETLLGLSLR